MEIGTSEPVGKFREKERVKWIGNRRLVWGREGLRSRMRIVGIHPAVFVRVATTGLLGYGK